MHKHSRHRAAIGLLLPLCIGGCSEAPVALDSHYVAPPPRNQPGSEYLRVGAATKPALRCELYLEALTDQRVDKQDMGNVAGRPIHGVDMTAWLYSGFASLAAAGYRVDTQASQAAGLVADVDLLKAYQEAESTSIASVIVVRITYKRPDGGIMARQLYRGSDTSINWANGDGEINTDFKLATADMLQKLPPDIDRYCEAARQPAPAAVTIAAAQK